MSTCLIPDTLFVVDRRVQGDPTVNKCLGLSLCKFKGRSLGEGCDRYRFLSDPLIQNLHQCVFVLPSFGEGCTKVLPFFVVAKGGNGTVGGWTQILGHSDFRDSGSLDLSTFNFLHCDNLEWVYRVIIGDFSLRPTVSDI